MTFAAGLLFQALIISAGAQESSTPPLAEVITLRQALTMGLEKNLGLQVQALEVPIGRENIIIEAARFDPAVEASLSNQYAKLPTSSAFSTDIYDEEREYAGEAAISKRFSSGLESSLSLESSRVTNNSAVTSLRPQYRSFLLLDLTQPLLRDFGTVVNTSDLRLSQNARQQAVFGFLNQARTLAAEVESAYYEVASGLAIVSYRQESLELARELLTGNRERQEAGIVPLTEVQEAETAVARRQEEVLFARQQLETVVSRLLNLLEIGQEAELRPEELQTELLPETGAPVPDLAEAFATALAQRADLKQQQLEIANRRILLRFYENQKLPRLDLDATLGVNGLSGQERPVSFRGLGPGTAAFQGDYLDSVDRMASGDGYEWFAGLVFSYPLGNRAAEARYRRAGWEKKQAIYQLQRLENEILTAVRLGLVEARRSLARVEVADKFQELAQTSLNQETERLRQGLSDTFRLLDFQDEVIEARIRRVTALADYHLGLTRLYRAMGANLERHRIVSLPDPERLEAGGESSW